ncbi:MAG: hypothetical protein KBC41_03625 [Candidatus Pacebacteria bacterium]|nr:hypothetical protein [Candidatus Paceibacterota bacterium]
MSQKIDPKERDPILGKIIRQAHKEAVVQLLEEKFPEGLGYCHVLWGRQQQILKEKYGVDWKSPSDMNPEIMYD